MQLTRSSCIALATIAGVLGLVACSASSSFEVSSGSGGFAGSSGAGGVASTGSGPVGPTEAPVCPLDEPDPGDYCTAQRASGCTYGPDVRDSCNERYDCKNGGYVHSTPDCANDCPKSFDAIVPGTACPDSKVACSYLEGTCGCVGSDVVPTPPDGGLADAGADGGEGGVSQPPPTPGTWKCVAPPTTPACPNARPRPPDPCVKAVTCDYGTCALGRALTYECLQGYWYARPLNAAGCQ